MPVHDPLNYRDKRDDWLHEFRARRVAALRPLITPALLAEHEAQPRGPHSTELQLVLNLVRGPAVPLSGKTFAYVRDPFRDYGLARMTARGTPTDCIDGASYADENAAQHAAFLERLSALGLHSPQGDTPR